MGAHGSPWAPMGTHGVPRKHVLFPVFIIHGFAMELSMDFPWFSHGFSIRFSMDVPWIDFPWILHELQNVSVVVAGTPLGVRKQSRHRHVVCGLVSACACCILKLMHKKTPEAVGDKSRASGRTPIERSLLRGGGSPPPPHTPPHFLSASGLHGKSMENRFSKNHDF